MIDKLLTLLKGEKKNDPVRDWCRSALPVLEEVEDAPAVQDWCRNEYSAYRPTAEQWRDWERKLYDIMHSAYEAGVVCPEYREILERNGISLGQAGDAEERWLQGLTEEELRGVLAFLIRADYGSNGFLIRCAVGEGRLLRAVKAYLKKTK